MTKVKLCAVQNYHLFAMHESHWRGYYSPAVFCALLCALCVSCAVNDGGDWWILCGWMLKYETLCIAYTINHSHKLAITTKLSFYLPLLLVATIFPKSNAHATWIGVCVCVCARRDTASNSTALCMHGWSDSFVAMAVCAMRVYFTIKFPTRKKNIKHTQYAHNSIAFSIMLPLPWESMQRICGSLRAVQRQPRTQPYISVCIYRFACRPVAFAVQLIYSRL